MKNKNSNYHVYTQQSNYVRDEIYSENGKINLLIEDIYADMKDKLVVFRKADREEFKDLMIDAIRDYIYKCQSLNGETY